MLFNSLLGGSGIFDPTLLTGDYAWLQPIAQFLDDILIPATIMLSIGAVFLVIAIGVALARAESSDKMVELKKRLWGIVITAVIVIGLVWLLAWLLPTLPEIMKSIRGI